MTIAPPDIHVPGGLFAVYSACESKPGPGPLKTVLGPETLSPLDFSNRMIFWECKMSDSDIEKDISEKINSPHGKIPMDKKILLKHYTISGISVKLKMC